MTILADKSNPFIKEACENLGRVRLFESTDFDSSMLAGCDVLLCRSSLVVNKDLLRKSSVRFVATATSGFDHVDVRYLRERGIRFAYAPGCNARSVAEYVVTALLLVAARRGFELRGKSVGIIGVGHVGTEVERMVRALEMIPILNDPPLASETGDPRYRPLSEALAADVVTLHVPLTSHGPWPTTKMIGKQEFASMKEGAVFLNTSRGGVVDHDALIEFARQGILGAVVLDVHENEPAFRTDVLDYIDVATPHVAGHAFDGKIRGTQMVYEALCAFLGVSPTWNYRMHVETSISLPRPALHPDLSLYYRLFRIIRQVCPVDQDDRKLRELADLPDDERGLAFHRYRNHYAARREFPAYKLTGDYLPD
ncbi:MAG: 4-phosphoerythronate dehydrogenase [Chlorobi bacterium]|nr:4-phosphoerythronate dehydrogenase [Chlorobiota bacterium]